MPATPETTLKLDAQDGVPVFTVKPDELRPVLAVDVFYTLQGRENERPEDRDDTVHRFWHHAAATRINGVWRATLPMSRTDQPLWVYANVRYELDEPVSGAGYYYGSYTAETFVLSSLLQVATADALKAAGVRATLTPSPLIEDFTGDWEREWFTYRPENWARTTNKLNADIWQAPPGSRLSLDVQAEEANRLVVVIDGFAAEVPIRGGEEWQQIVLEPTDFRNHGGDPLVDWNGVRQLKLSPAERLRPGRGSSEAPRLFGGNWQGAPPRFRNLKSWQVR